MSTNDSGVNITCSKQGLTVAEREREQHRARIDRKINSQEDRERERTRARERRQNSTEQYREVQQEK